MNYRNKDVFLLCLLLTTFLGVSLYRSLTPMIFNLSASSKSNQILNLVNLYEPIHENFTCVLTKYLLDIVQTTICVHSEIDSVSRSIIQQKIWEEAHLKRLFTFLIREPQFSLIDVGANIGTYTMFGAALRRFVVAIECFKPNLDRIRKAVQLGNYQKNVVLIGNAIYKESGKYLKIESVPDNIGGQSVITNNTMSYSDTDLYIVKTIRFDDILPVLKENGIREAIMKVDIQWSEIFLCETCQETFAYVNISVVFMEWAIRDIYVRRMIKLLTCLSERGYYPTSDMCAILRYENAFVSWPSDVYWIKVGYSPRC